jgi:pimeloyl-ACP methyl ester carboxylesterase
MIRIREYTRPPEAPPPRPVSGMDLRQEWRIGRDALRLGLELRYLGALPRGDREPALLIPGWKAPEASMTPLRLFLRSRGYDARHWGLGTNQGDPERDAERLAPMVSDRSARLGRPVGLIGWSLGGVIARETARRVPDAVAVVVTFGTPVIGGPTYTIAGRSYGRRECERVSRLIEELDAALPIRAPIAALFTRHDRFVSWPACIDRASPNVTHYEVDSSHLSMGLDPTVWAVVLEQLHRYGKRPEKKRR